MSTLFLSSSNQAMSNNLPPPVPPNSAPNQGKRVSSASQKAGNRTQSYEELLVSKYLEQIQQTETKPNQSAKHVKRLELDSPYLQKLSHSNLLQTLLIPSQRTGSQTNINSTRSNRSVSRTNSMLASRPASGMPPEAGSSQLNLFNLRDKPLSTLGSAKQFSSRNDSINNSNPALHLSLRKERPSSAPLDRGANSQTIRSNTKYKSNGLSKQPYLIKALAYRNGGRQSSAHVAARNIIEFLEIATDKLQCPRAARRLFLENGDEIKHESQFMKNTVVYVSCGEDFDDPFLKTKKLVDQRRSVVWTSDGVHFLQNDTNSYQMEPNDQRTLYTSAKPPKNNRYSQSRQTKRITVYENGTEYSPTIALFEPIGVRRGDESYDKLEKSLLQDFLEECKDRLKMTSMVRAAYNWLGHPVRSIHDIPKLDKCLQPFVNDSEYSPVWVSRGEGFDSRGALGFITELLKDVRDQRKHLAGHRKKMLKTLEDLKREQMNSTSMQKTTQQRIYEINDNISKLQDEMNELNESLSSLESVRDEIKSLYESQANNDFSSLYSHIKEIDTNSKIFGGSASKAIKLKIFLNGTDEPIANIYFNQKESLMAKSDHVGLHSLLNQITRLIHNSNRSAPATFTRLFNEHGDEVTSTKGLKYDDSIWVSQGENWKSFQTLTLSMPVDMLTAVRMHDSGSDSARHRQFENSQTIITDTGTEMNDEPTTIPVEADPDDEFEVDDAADFFRRDNSKLVKPAPKKTVEIKPPASSANTTSSVLLSNLKVYRDELSVEKVKKYDKPEFWDLIDGFELERKLNSIASPPSALGMMQNAREIDARKSALKCLQCKRDKNLVLSPSLRLMPKPNQQAAPAPPAQGGASSKSDSVWFSNFQTWKFNKAGFIYNSFFPKMCLALNTSVSIQLDLHLKKSSKQVGQSQQQSSRSNFFDDEFQVPSKGEILSKRGHAVVLSSRLTSEDTNYRDRDQQWGFNLTGNIYSKAFEGKQLVLTSVDMLLRELNSATGQTSGSVLEKYDLRVNENNATLSNQDSNHFNSSSLGIHDLALIILEPFDSANMSRLASSQRWAIKQENSRSIGEWRLSELATPEWHKLAYTWPIDEKENLIKHFSWPISGYLIPGAPSLRTLEGCIESQRTRLRVVKNGCLDLSTAVTVSRIDNKNLMKQYIHCTNVSYRQFEFDIFLDTCTSALNLPNAARRIFDETGKEHFDLSQLGQDQLIYVTSGDPWIPPKLIRMEQERKVLLANLSDDLSKIGHFNKLKACDHLVIESINSSLQDGVKLALGPCCLSVKQIERIKKGESIQMVIELEDLDEEIVVTTTKKTAHELTHERVDASRKKQKPWDVIVSKSTDGIFGEQTNKSAKSDRSRDSSAESVSKSSKMNPGFDNSNGELLDKDVEVNQSSSMINLRDSMISLKSQDNDLREKFKPRPKKPLKNVKLASQKFAYSKSNGFIYSLDNPNLVFAVSDAENNLNELYLMRKNEDNLNQRWVFKSANGTIASKTRPNLVLTVKLPSLESADIDLTDKPDELDQKANEKSILSESAIILQPYIDSENGNAHQKWSIDDKIGFIRAFATEKLNIEITAANKASVCTNYIAEGQEIVQPGYLCEYPVEEEASPNQQGSTASQKILKIFICNACAKGTRGKFKLLKLTRPEKFCCYMGANCKDKSLNQYTGFKYLTNKVALSSNESENTFKKWFATFGKLRVNSNAKSVLNELSAARTLQMVKLFAYKNGDGRLKKGELLIGSSITNILDLATKKLELRGAARRIYTEDGTLILDIQDLVTWCIDYYRKEFNRKDSFDHRSETLSISSAKNKQVKIDTSDYSKRPSNLLDRVDFGQFGMGSASKKESTLSDSASKSMELAAKMLTVEKEKPFKGPSKRELDRMHEEYAKKNYLDPRKVLRWPIEVWISCGEAFVLPSTVAKNETQKIMQRENIDKAEHELEKQAHALRQMTGRRLAGMNLGKLRSSKHADSKEGHWNEVTYEEQVKQAEVNQLKSFVEEMKNPNKNNHSSGKIKVSPNLYGNHPITKRVRIYVNGQSPEKAQHCWASSIPELNEMAKIKLNLSKPIKFFFTEEGNIISRFEDIVRDQLVCVSTGREFISPDMRLKEIEIKANWGRIKKTQGLDATNLKVESVPNPVVNVDPFGPAHSTSKPLLALPAPSSRSNVSSSATKASQNGSKSDSHFSIKLNNEGLKKDQRRPKIEDDEHDDDDDIVELSTKSAKSSSSKPKKKRSAMVSASSADFDNSKSEDLTAENSLSVTRRRKSKSPGSKKSKSRSPKKVQIDNKPPHYLEISNDEMSKSVELSTSAVSNDYSKVKNGEEAAADETYIDEEIYDEVNFDKESN